MRGEVPEERLVGGCLHTSDGEKAKVINGRGAENEERKAWLNGVWRTLSSSFLTSYKIYKWEGEE